MIRTKPLSASPSGWMASVRCLRAIVATTIMATTALAAEPEPGSTEKAPELIRSKGAFAELWNERFFVRPGVLACPAGDRNAPKLRLPGDFEKHEAIVVGGGWLAREAPDVLFDIVSKTKPVGELAIVVSSDRERELAVRVLAERGVLLDASRWLTTAVDTGWVRDFGPIFVCDSSGGRLAIDAVYDKPGRDRDDAAARAIADHFKVSAIATGLRWHGGNILSNGRGLLVTTTQSINANVACGDDVDVVTRFLRQRFGADRVVVLEHLVGEGTGHIDMYACFTSPDTIVVGQYDDAVDPRNAALLDRSAASLAAVGASTGKLNVVRVPMPSNRDGRWRSFTNVVFANGVLLVPVYPDVAQADGERALKTYRQLLPDWQVFGVDASAMAKHQGGLRCVTLYVPTARKEEGR
jgi:agmatine deiminase